MTHPTSKLMRIRPEDEQTWPDSLSDPARALLKYWVSKCEHGRFPARSAIEPCEIKQILPYLFIVERTDGDESDYRFRLVGTQIVRIEGECTGKRLTELFGDRRRHAGVWRHYDEACQGRIYVRHEDLGWQEKAFIDYEVVLLPLRGDGDEDVGFLIGAAHGTLLPDHTTSAGVVRFVRPVLDLPTVSLGLDGIFIVDYRSEGLAISPARMRFSEQKILELSEGQPVPVAILADAISGFGKERLADIAGPEPKNAVLASAIVSQSPTGQKLLEAFLDSQRAPYPIEAFASLEEAKSWLHTFM